MSIHELVIICSPHASFKRQCFELLQHRNTILFIYRIVDYYHFYYNKNNVFAWKGLVGQGKVYFRRIDTKGWVGLDHSYRGYSCGAKVGV